MAKGAETRESFTRARAKFVAEEGPATARAEQKARKTKALDPLVDPAGYGVIRRSLPRFEQRAEDGLWEMAVGLPVPIEERVDTTGSMGNNVDVVIRVMPELYGLSLGVLPGCDPQIAAGIFGDVGDRWFDGTPAPVLCRPQFEMSAEKIIEQLTLMVPMRDGGDGPEDPHYGIFGAAYLTATYISRLGLKGYDFTISDASAHERLDERQLVRVYGKEVFEKVAENGHQMSKSDLPSIREMVKDLLKIAHAFFLQVGNYPDLTAFWAEKFGQERCVVLPDTELLPQVQATIIGLTEGTLDLQQVPDFLRQNNVSKEDAKRIVRSVANIPIGAQAALPNFSRRPKKGDVFREKTDLWPIDPSECPKKDKKKAAASAGAGPSWL